MFTEMIWMRRVVWSLQTIKPWAMWIDIQQIDFDDSKARLDSVETKTICKYSVSLIIEVPFGPLNRIHYAVFFF